MHETTPRHHPSGVINSPDHGRFDPPRPAETPMVSLVDADGNLWSSAGDGVHVFSPEGTLLGKIRVPETVANLCFGGNRGNRLFLTATTSLYAVFVTAAWAGWPT